MIAIAVRINVRNCKSTSPKYLQPCCPVSGTVSSRTTGHRVGGCPVCANQRVYEGVNDLATTHPKLLTEWHWVKNEGILPTKISGGTHRKVWWICSADSRHEWFTAPAYRSGGAGTACPFCSNKRVLPGVNDFATVWPKLAKEWHPSKNGQVGPSDISPGSSSKKYWWKCAGGHEFFKTVNARTNLGARCK